MNTPGGQGKGQAFFLSSSLPAVDMLMSVTLIKLKL